ncbi:MAG: hypothetical protein OXC99_05255 [Chloroflexi bacterium]|nr:hypothetical protein [Chloroflexota bacterium]
MDEGFGLGEFAGCEEVAHLLREGGDGVGAVQVLPPHCKRSPCLVGGTLQILLALPEFHDVIGGRGHVDAVALRYEVPDAAQLLLHVVKLLVDGLQFLAMLPSRSVHLLVQELHEVADVGLGEDVGAQLIDDGVLELLGVEPGGIAGAAARLHQGLADVVGVLAALGLGGGHCPAAGRALEQPAEQVGAGRPPGVRLLRGA